MTVLWCFFFYKVIDSYDAINDLAKQYQTTGI